MLRPLSHAEKASHNETVTPSFIFRDDIFTTIPLWVKLPNLPLSYWNVVVLSKIESSLGQPLYADECTTSISRISFARFLIEMDVTKPLPKSIKIQEPIGRVFEQPITNE